MIENRPTARRNVGADEATVPPIFVVIPALDEEDSLPLVLRDLDAIATPLAEIIVVDNGSRDATSSVARKAGASVLFEARRGYGAACMRALSRVSSSDAARRDDALVVFLDADYSDYPQDLEALIEPLLSGRADLALGSRLTEARARAAVPLPSRLGNAMAAFVMHARYGVRFTDLGPFRAITLEALARLGMRDRTWGWTVEMQLRACQHRLAIEEVPVRYRPRHAGASKISGSVWGGVRAATKILWVLSRHLLGEAFRLPRLGWLNS